MQHQQQARSAVSGTVVRESNVEPFANFEEEYTERDNQKGQFLKSYLDDGYESYHPSKVLDLARTDNQVFESLVKSAYESEIDDEETYLQEKGMSRETAMSKTRQNLRNFITDTTYTGEEISKTIGDTYRQLRGSQGMMPISSAEREIRERSSVFSDLIGEDGNLVLDQQSLQDTLYSDNELYGKVVRSSLDSFNKQLQAKHNTGVLDPSMASQNPEEYAKAYAIYEKYGKEGLSQYINYFQYGDTDKPYAEQSATAQRAMKFLSQKQEDGQTPLQYADTTVSQMEFKPRRPKTPKPAIYNNYSKIWMDQDPIADERVVVNADGVKGFTDFARSVYSGELGEDPDESFLKSVDSEAINFEALTERNDEVLPADIVEALQSESPEGVIDADGYGNLLRFASRQLLNDKNNLGVSYGDIFGTLKTYAHQNGGYRQKSNGDPEFRINYEKAPLMVKFAMDLVTSRSATSMFARQDGDEMVLEPNRLQDIQERGERAYRGATFNKKVEQIVDDEGNVVDEYTLETRFGLPDDAELVQRDGNRVTRWVTDNSEGMGSNAMWNTGAMLSYTVAQFGTDIAKDVIFGDRTGGALIKGFSALKNGLTTGEFESTEEARKMADGIYESMKEFSLTAPTSYTDSYVQKGVAIATPFIGYLGLIRGMGRAGNRGIGKIMSKGVQGFRKKQRLKDLTSLLSARNMNSASKYLKLSKNGSNWSKTQLMFRRLADGMKKTKGTRRDDVAGYLDYITGGAMYNIVGSMANSEFNDESSLMGSGVVDMGLDAVGIDSDVEGWYESIGGNAWYNGLLKTGTSILAEEVLGHTIDTVFGLARFGKAGLMRTVGKEYSGIKFNPKTNGYRKVESMLGEKGARLEGFSPDYRRFFHNINKDLAELPRADYTIGLRNSAKGIASSAKLMKDDAYFSDFASDFTSKVKPFMSTIRKDIEETIKMYERNFGGTLTDVQVKALSEVRYREFLGNIANGMSEIFPNRQVYDSFVTALRNTEDVTVNKLKSKSGNAQMDIDEARLVAKESDNARIEEVDINGEIKYEVVDFEMAEWLSDLTTAFRLRAKGNDKINAKKRFLDSERTDELADDDVAVRKFDEFYDEEVTYKDKRYRVVGLGADEFELEDAVGRRIKAPMDYFQKTNTGGQVMRDMSEVQQRLTEGKVLLAGDEKLDVDTKSVSGINDGLSTIRESLERWEKRINNGEVNEPEAVALRKKMDEYNKIADFLESRKKILEKGKDGKRSMQKLSEDDLQKEAESAKQWLESEDIGVDLNDRGSLQSTITDLEERASELMTQRMYGKDNEGDKADALLDEVNKALYFLNGRKKQLDKGVDKFNSMSDGVKQWLEFENGRMVNIDDLGEVQKRADFLRGLLENDDQTVGVSGLNKSQMKGALNFLDQRVEDLRGSRLEMGKGNESANNIKKGVIAKEKEAQNSSLFESLAKTVKKVTDKLTSKKLRNYRSHVMRSRKKDPKLQETGLQGTFLSRLFQGIDDIEQGNTVSRNVGGSPATDYTSLNGGKAVRKYDPEKGGKTGQIYYIENGDGTVDHVVINQKPVHPYGGTDETITPTRHIEIDGELRLNPYYRFISPNELTSKTGELNTVKIAGDVSDPRPEFDGPVVEVTKGGQMVANVQRSVDGTTKGKMKDVDGMQKTDFHTGNYDAIRFKRNGKTYYKLVSLDQAMDKNQVKNVDLLDTTKFDYEDTSPSFKAEGANSKGLDPFEKGEAPERVLDGEDLYNDEIREAWNNRGVPTEEDEFGTSFVRKGNRVFMISKRGGENGRYTAFENDKVGIEEYNEYYDAIVAEGSTRQELLDELSFIERNTRQIESERILADLEDAGIKNEKVKRSLRNAEFEKEVDGNSRPYDPDRTKVPIEEAEVGSWISVRKGDELVNAKVTKNDGSFVTYRPINEYGLLGKEQSKEVGGFSSDSLFKPFSMKTKALIVASTAGASTLDLDLSDYDADQAGLFTNLLIAGALFSLAKKGYKVYRRSSMLKQVTRKGFSEDEILAKELGFEDMRDTLQELESMGVYAKPTDKGYSQTVNEIRNVVTDDDETKIERLGKRVLHSSVFESTVNMTRRLDSEKGEEFGKLMEDMPAKIQILRNRSERQYNLKHGNNAFKKLMREGIEKVDDLVPKTYRKADEIVPRSSKDIELEKKELFNLGLWRLMNSKIEQDENGKYFIAESTGAIKAMDEGDQSSKYQKLDNKFLEDEEIMDAVSSMRSNFSEIEQEWKKLITNFEYDALRTIYLSDKKRTIKDADGNVHSFSELDYYKFADDFFLGFEGTWRQYIDAHDDPVVRKLLRNGMKYDEGIKRLAKVRNAKLKFTEGLGEMYMPQIVSQKKVAEWKGDLSEEEFNKKLYEQVAKINENKGAVHKFDADTNSLQIKQFKSADHAVNYIQRMLANSTGKVEKNARLGFERKFGSFSPDQEGKSYTMAERLKREGVLEERTVEVDEGNGRKRLVKRYVIANPDDFKVEYEGTEYDIVKLANQKATESLYDKMMMGDYVKNSNFLERPREYTLPHQVLETDPEIILDRYSRDVGMRLEMAKKNVFNEDDLKGEFWTPIRNDLVNAGVKDPESYINRYKTVYQTLANILPELAGKENKKEFLKKKRMAQQASELYRNFLYGTYASTIAMYDTIQPLISTAQYTSYKSTFKAYKDVFNNRKLQILQDASEEYGVVRKQLESVLADFDDSAKLGGSGDDIGEQFLGGLNGWSRKYQRFWTQKFDFTHALPKKLRATNALRENAGVRLVFGNLMNKNEVNLPLNWMAHMYEANKLAKHINTLKSGEEVRGMSEGDIYNKFALMGLTRDDADYFAKNIDHVNERLEGLTQRGERLSGEDTDPRMEEMMEMIIQRATETYHGKNVSYRPSTWLSDAGRVATTFQNFAFNQALQITKRRIFNPLNDFVKKYPDAGKRITVMKWATMSKLSSPKKRRTYLKKQGLSDEMIDDLPMNSVDGIVRAIMATGMSRMFYFTMDAGLALLSMSILEGVVGFEDDKADKQLEESGYSYRKGGFELSNMVLNPDDDLDKQIRLGDFDDAKGISDGFAYMSAMTSMFGSEMMNIGLTGPMASGAFKYGDIAPAGLSMGIKMSEDAMGFLSDGPQRMTSRDNAPRQVYNLARTYIAPMKLLNEASYVRE
jgi:hypothetical protein